MPIPRRAAIGRRGWSADHELQLITGHDFFNTAWGLLSALPDEESIRAAVADMAACWRAHRDEILSTKSDPWFAAYLADPEELVREALADPYRPRLIEQQTAAAAPAVSDPN